MKKTTLLFLLLFSIQGLYANKKSKDLGENRHKIAKKGLGTQKRQAKKKVRFKKKLDKLKKIINRKKTKLNADVLTIFLYFGLVITSIILIIVATGVWQTIGIIALSVLALLFLYMLWRRRLHRSVPNYN